MKLHLGCGARIEPGWVNIDSSPCPDGRTADYLQLDMRQGLPGDAGRVDLIYSEHFFEHLTLEEGATLLQECYRVLKPGGGIRISVPSLEVLVENYIRNNITFAAEVGWMPATACQMLNGGMRLWEHKFMYDFVELKAALQRAGFTLPYRMDRGASAFAGMLYEGRPDLGEIIVEAVR